MDTLSFFLIASSVSPQGDSRLDQQFVVDYLRTHVPAAETRGLEHFWNCQEECTEAGDIELMNGVTLSFEEAPSILVMDFAQMNLAQVSNDQQRRLFKRRSSLEPVPLRPLRHSASQGNGTNLFPLLDLLRSALSMYTRRK